MCAARVNKFIIIGRRLITLRVALTQRRRVHPNPFRRERGVERSGQRNGLILRDYRRLNPLPVPAVRFKGVRRSVTIPRHGLTILRSDNCLVKRVHVRSGQGELLTVLQRFIHRPIEFQRVVVKGGVIRLNLVYMGDCPMAQVIKQSCTISPVPRLNSDIHARKGTNCTINGDCLVNATINVTLRTLSPRHRMVPMYQRRDFHVLLGVQPMPIPQDHGHQRDSGRDRNRDSRDPGFVLRLFFVLVGYGSVGGFVCLYHLG